MGALERLARLRAYNRRGFVAFVLLALCWVGLDWAVRLGVPAGSSLWAYVAIDVAGIIGGIVICIRYFLRVIRSLERIESEHRTRLQQLESSRQLLQYYKDALDVSALVLVTDANGAITQANETFCRTMGYSETELIGQNPRIFRSGFQSGDWYAAMWQQLRRGEVKKHEICDLAKDGQHVWLDVTILPRMGLDGQPIQYMMVNFDISEVKMVQIELAAERERALAAVRAKSDFLANMSHEIRTPMNALLGMTELLQSTLLTEEQDEFVSIMSTSGRILLALLNDILDAAKIEAGGLELEVRPLILGELVSDVTTLFLRTAQAKGVVLRSVSDPALSRAVLGDPLRLTQILSNLTSNAVKFTDKGEIVLSVRNVGEREGRVIVEFRVRDSGCGMSEAQISRLFVPFTQGDCSVARTHGGTGLGLSISQRLVRLMGGEIRVQSRDLVGSEFVFTLEMPLTDVTLPVGVGRVARIEQSLSLFPPELRQRRIAVAEDNLANRKLIEAALRRMGFTPIMVENGRQLLDVMNTTSIDLVLMDSQMPVMGGCEAARAIVAWYGASHPPLVLVTAFRGVNPGRDIDVKLFDGVLQKPTDFFALREMIMELLTSQGDGMPRVVPSVDDGMTARVSLLRKELEDDDVVVQILEAFLESSVASEQALLAMEPEDSGDKKRRPAHALCGSARNVGAQELADYLEVLEIVALTSNEEWRVAFDGKKLSGLLDAARKEIGALIAGMRSA